MLFKILEINIKLIFMLMTKINLDNVEYLETPFSHCVIDNFFDKDTANKLYEKVSSLKCKDANTKFKNKT